MSKIPVRKCPECNSKMKYLGGMGGRNVVIMICPREGCGYQEPCYVETKAKGKKGESVMERRKLPPLAVTIEMPSSTAHFTDGDEIIMIFHAVPGRFAATLGFAMQAIGCKLSTNGASVTCHVKVVKDTVIFSPARIENETGEMYSPRDIHEN